MNQKNWKINKQNERIKYEDINNLTNDKTLYVDLINVINYLVIKNIKIIH